MLKKKHRLEARRKFAKGATLVGMLHVGEGLYAWGGLRTPGQYARLNDEMAGLKELNLRTAKDFEIRRALNAFGLGYLTRVMWSVPITSFRASRPTNIDKPWGHLSELWAPPAKFTTRGRFNEKGKPVLYISSDPGTALMEVQSKPYELRVVLVLKKIDTKIRFHFVQVGIEKMQEENIVRNAFGEVKDGLRQEPILVGKLKGRGVFDFWLTQDTILGEICTKHYSESESEVTYRLTLAISEQLQKVKNVVGISYPSVANNHRGINIAMPVNIARASLRPVEAWLFHFGGRLDPPGVGKPRLYEGKVVRRGFVQPGGAIAWGDLGEWDVEKLHRQIAPAPERATFLASLGIREGPAQ